MKDLKGMKDGEKENFFSFMPFRSFMVSSFLVV
jgi:hypothetical protein